MAHYRQDEVGYWRLPEKFASWGTDSEAYGVKISVFVMGDPESEDVPAALVMEMQPHVVFARHAHPCERFEIVVKGSLLVDGGKELRPGDVMTASPGELYGPHIAGPEGATLVEFFGTVAGAHTMIYDSSEGNVTVDFLAGGIRPAGVSMSHET